MQSGVQRRQASLLDGSLKSALLYVLLVEACCVSLVECRPTDEPLVGVTHNQASEPRQDFSVLVNFTSAASKMCHICRRGFYAEDVPKRQRTMTTRHPRRVRVSHRPGSALRHTPKCSRCRPCSVCLYDMKVATPCTSTQDTQCTPLCRDKFYFDRARRTCRMKVKIIHEVVVVANPTGVTTASNHEVTVLTDPVMNLPSIDVGRLNKGRDASQGAVEAGNEEGSPGYMTSLFASGAAGITVLILAVLVIVYLVLRFKQWWKYDRALQRDRRHCSLIPSCFGTICKQGNSSVSSNVETDYSTSSNQNTLLRQHQRTLVNSQATRPMEPSRVSMEFVTKTATTGCQNGSDPSHKNNRRTDTDSSPADVT